MLKSSTIKANFSKSDIIAAILPLAEKGEGTQKEQIKLINAIILILMNLKEIKKDSFSIAFNNKLSKKNEKLIFVGTQQEAFKILTKLINEL